MSAAMAVKRTEEGLNPGRRSAAQRRTAALECDAKMRARSHDTAKSFQKSSHSLYNSRYTFTRWSDGGLAMFTRPLDLDSLLKEGVKTT